MVKTRATVFVMAALLLASVGAGHAQRAQSVRTKTPGLADAAERADWTKVSALLTQAVEVNAVQADGMTALHWAAYHDRQEIVSLLLSAHATVSAANRYGITPLSLACTNGSAAVVNLLLKAGADPNKSLPGGETPLMTAARSGTLAVVQSLLARGATVEAKDDRRGQT